MKTLFQFSVISVLVSMCLSGNVMADKIVLCFSPIDQYIVKAEAKSDCMEEEQYAVLSGPSIKEVKDITPAANFENNEDCVGEGMITEIGFDENNNGKLDLREVVSVQLSCSTSIVEEGT